MSREREREREINRQTNRDRDRDAGQTYREKCLREGYTGQTERRGGGQNQLVRRSHSRCPFIV